MASFKSYQAKFTLIII